MKARATRLPVKMDKSAPAACSSCTLYLVRRCYGRSVWFPVFREPLAAGMRLLGRLHGIDHSSAEGPGPDCRGCLRHLKNRLKEVSPLFIFLNRMANPVFNALRDRLVSKEDKAAAKDFASGRRALPFRAAAGTEGAPRAAGGAGRP